MCKCLDREELPEWVEWLAQDADGWWWGYEVEPNQHYRGWYENELGRNIKLNKSEPDANWCLTLERVIEP